MNWNNYAKLYDWEFDLVCSDQKEDIRIWKKLAAGFGGPILELCCGSGRITKVLAEEGYKITALDNSKEMLKLLKQKELKNVKILKADMKDFSCQERFNFAFISYSSFQQLLSLKEQQKCLLNIKRHLKNNGALGMDISPLTLAGPDKLPMAHLFTADHPESNSTISMYTSHRIDWINGIKHWNDEYIIKKNGNKYKVKNKISLKQCSKDYMKVLSERCDFEIETIYGDFERGEVTENSKNLIYVMRKKG